MKIPELNDLISESYPRDKDKINSIELDDNNENFIIELRNKIYELEQENLLCKEDNLNLNNEIKNLKNKLL